MSYQCPLATRLPVESWGSLLEMRHVRFMEMVRALRRIFCRSSRGSERNVVRDFVVCLALGVGFVSLSENSWLRGVTMRVMDGWVGVRTFL